MKIRTDFVTNSSSSSFVTINIKTKDGNFKLKEDEFIGCIELVNNMDNEDLAFVIRCAFGYNDYLSKDAVALIENIKKIDMKTVEFIELQEVNDDDESEGDGRTAYKHFYSGITGQWYETKKELNCEEKKFFSEKKKYRNVELVGTGKDGRAPNHEYMSVGDSVELVREPDNPFDANAILVKGKGRGLGYLSEYLAKNISWKLDTGKFIVKNAKVSSATPLSQRSKSAKNPIMEIDFDIIPVDSDFVTNSSSSSFVTINIKTKDGNFKLKEDESIGCVELVNNMDNEALAFVIRCAFGYNDYLSKDAVALIENIKKIDMKTVEFIELQEVNDDDESEGDGRTAYKHFYSGITGQWYDTKKELNCEEKKFFSEKEKYRNVELVGTGKDGRAPNHEYMSVGDSVELVREPDNPFDANAILVKGKGRGLGHLSAYLAKNISWKLDTGKFVVENAKVSSATPLSQRSKSAKNPIMEIDFDIIPVDSETKTDSQKNIAKSAQQKKSTSAKEKSKNGSKPSDEKNKLSIEEIKESVMTEVFETIVDGFDESDDVKQSVKEHFYHSFYGCIFLLLFLHFGVKESELDAQELSEIIISEEFRSVLGVTTIEVGIMIEIKSLIEELLENGDEEDLAETILSSNIMVATMENEMYQNFTYDLERVCPKLSVGMEVMRNQLEEFEQQIKGMISNVLSDLGYADEDDEDEDDDDFDPVVAEKAKAEIVDALSDISASLDSMLEKTKILAEEARQREQAEIDEATKRGKYIPIEFKPNNIFPKDFAELLEQGKPYPKYSENDFETFVRRVKEIIASDISDVPEDVLYIEVLGWYADSVEYNSEIIVKLWNNYLRSLKGEETDFSTCQIDLWGISACDAIDAALFELDNKFWLNGFVSEGEDFEIDAKGLLKKYNGTASNIVIPEGVTQFASGKFYNSNKKISNVTSLTLPSTLKKVDIQSELPFQKLRSLSRVDVSADNEVFSSVDGVLLSKDGTELIYYPVAKRAEEYKVPATVTKIRSGAFTRNHYIKKLIISGNVVDTGENNFCNCTSLVTVIFENGVKIIGKNSFAECTSLQEVFVSESVEKLLMTTFAKCAGIKTIYACEGSKAMVNAEKLSTKLGAKLIVCKPGQVYDDVSVKPEKQETKTVTKATANSVQAAQPDTQPQQSTTTVKSQSKANNGTVSAPPPVAEKIEDKPKKSGCYVATSVYGSYDCPQVWTLRRFRDYSLAASLLGRLFIMVYYAISPTLVKWFGNTKWFKKIWKAILDKMVEKLQRNGFENTPYQDRNY